MSTKSTKSSKVPQHTVWHSFYCRVWDYNLFVPDENDYDEVGNDPAIALKHQKYTTRLYILLLTVSMYVLFYMAMMKPEARTVIIKDIDLDKFEKLYSEHGEILSCPCSTVITAYKTFVSNTIKIHPVCLSFFVSQQWIEALYLANRTKYGVGDFRTTAASQFQLLSSLCSFSQEIIYKNEINLDNNEFITTSLLSESKIQSEVNVTVQLFKSSLSSRILSFINYLRFITRANNFISSLNTNGLISLILDHRGIFLTGEFEIYNPNIYNDMIADGISCGNENPTSPTAFFARVFNSTSYNGETWRHHPSNSTLVNGFFAGCTPLEALLKSTLDCLYDVKCLQLLTNYFPSINQTNLNLTNYVIQSEKSNLNLSNHLSNLFIDQWITTVNYSKYFHHCNSSVCTYATTDMINYSFAFTMFISLYGGLILILRSISPFLINILMKLKDRQATPQNLIQWMKQVNLFKSANKRTEEDIKQQRITSHVYSILLIISMTTLLIFNSLNTQTVLTSISKPSLNTYIDLQRLYSNELRCPCSTIAIPQYQFISLSPTLHSICSSDFITDRWISILTQITVFHADLDWRNKAYQQYSLLSKLCQLSNETVTNAINEFLSQLFIISNLLTNTDFNTQINKKLFQFYQSTIVNFRHFMEAVNLHIQVDQPFMVTSTSYYFTIDLFTRKTIVTNTTNNEEITEVTVSPTYNLDIYSKTIKCLCSMNPHCQRPSAIFDVDITEDESSLRNLNVSYILNGSFVGCSNIDSVLLSTFECLYSDSSCFPILINYIKQGYIWNTEYPPWSDVQPLVYNSSLTRFYRNTSISMIVKEIMIEKWNSSYSYENFYHSCSPTYCIYPQRIHTKNIIGILFTLISMIGGLILSLRLFTPYLVRFVIIIISKITKKQEEEEEVVLNWSDRLKSIKQKLITTLYNVVINLNIFPPHTFGNHIDRITAKRLGQQTTRLYLFLLIVIFIILILYSITQQQILTKDFNEPTFDTYNQLIQSYEQDLKCSCSSIASTYDQFVQIKPVFHQICSSSFVTDEMIDHLEMILSSNISTYEERDYRRIISSHIQYLKGLCEISIDSVNNLIKQFLSTLFITKQLLSRNEFNQNIDSSIEKIKLNAPNTLNFMFFLIRNINYGNSIISTYGTNFKYVTSSKYTVDSILQTDAVIYDNECSCGLHSNCTSQAYFIESNSSKKIPIKGLKIGCTPSESFLSSTLECFYDYTCIHLIKRYTNSLEPLSIITNQSRMNSTINQLITNLFIDQWLTTKNYSSYFHQCLPSLCSYSYIQKFNIIYIISFLLGLQGGLMIVLKWICPKIIQFIVKINQYRKQRTNNIVHPEHSLETVTTDIVSENNPTITNDLQSSLSFFSYRRSLKMTLICILLMVLIVAVILFSIYIARQKYNQVSQEISSILMTISGDINTSSTSILSTTMMSFCTLIFEAMPVFPPGSGYPSSPIIGDFNNDNQLDIGFINPSTADNHSNTADRTSLFVLLGNGDGTFGKPIIPSIRYFSPEMSMAVADFNQDHLLDIVLADIYTSFITIVLGNGDGTFREGTILYSEDCYFSGGLSIADFNSDSYLDIAVACDGYSNVSVFFGDINGSFLEKITLYTGEYSSPLSTVIADFNGDNYSDIAIVDDEHRTVGVFLGYGNGSFDMQKISFAGGGINPLYITVGDFNEDTNQDVVLSYVYGRANGVMFGYGNGTFGEKIRLVVESGYIYMSAAVSDFNKDGHLDIATITMSPYAVDIFFGDGNGKFETCRIFSTEFYGSFASIMAGDFNADGYPDLITTYQDPGGVHVLLSRGQYSTSQTTIH